MKKFLKYTFLFFLTLSATLLMNLSIVKRSNTRVEKDIVFLGHSHAECAYNDSLIYNSINLSRSGEAYIYTLAKAKSLVVSKSKFKIAFIEFSNNQIAEFANESIWSTKYLNGKYHQFSPFLTAKDNMVLFYNNPLGFISGFSNSFKEKFKKVVRNHSTGVEELGGHLKLEYSRVDSLLNVPYTNVEIENQEYVSENSISYLKSLINFLESNDIQVFLVRSPVHPRDPDLVNEELFLSVVQDNFSSYFMDFKMFPLENSELGDFGHLNKIGAEKYSVWINSIIEKGLFRKENKQDFIDTEIELLSNK